MVKKSLKVVGMLVALCIISSNSMLYATTMRGAEYDALGSPRIGKELDLSEEQKEALKEQRFRMKLAKTKIRNKIKIRELELRHEMEARKTDERAVKGIVKELKELHGALLELRVDSILEMKEILTYEQFEQLQSLTKKNKKKRLWKKWHNRSEE